MRWMIMLCLLAGCAATPEPRAKWESAPDWLFDADAVTYERPADAALQAKDGWVGADLTLVDLDAGAAKRLLGIEEPRDIDPRAVSKPAGETAMLLAESYDAGKVIARRTLELELGQATSMELTGDVVFISDGPPDGGSGITLSSVTTGTSGELKVSASEDGRWLIQTDTRSSLVALQSFNTIHSTGQLVAISTPSVVQMHRAAVESVKSGQTAVFQLCRAGDYEIFDAWAVSRRGSSNPRILLLFVRITDGG